MKLTVFFCLVSSAFAAHPKGENGSNGKIVGGSEIAFSDASYQVSIQYIGHICSGVIVGESKQPLQWVLTAASCIAGISERLTTIRYGTVNQLTGGAVMQVDQFVINPKYDRTAMHHDIALIKIKGQFDSLLYRYPADLPAQDELPVVGSLVRASGWGYQSANNLTIPNSLQAVKLPILNTYENCHRVFKQFDVTLICSNTVCAGDLNYGGKGICGRGDGGAPLVMERENKVIGVGSFSFGCGHPEYPSVFTMVSRYSNWIKGYVNDPKQCRSKEFSGCVSQQNFSLPKSI